MEITEVRIKLMESTDDRLQAFCSITFDNCFVVRDLKIILGDNGPFVAMPSRKLTFHCPECGQKNPLKACYCNQCGTALQSPPVPRDADGRPRLYADIAHPINAECREMIQRRVIEEFENEKIRARQPGYVSRYDEAYGDIAPAIDAGPEDDLGRRDMPGARVPPPHMGRQTRRASRRPRRGQAPSQQPPASGPRPAPPPTPPPSPPANPPRRNDDFGAGIFDDQ
ncbi:MAG: hypothetical protein KatS3mg110_3904 [Pirellulaceae bacterium]|nr:MAG: hypothetical protein KatS3mg110_3904 [Pirellulaceae bacterium]